MIDYNKIEGWLRPDQAALMESLLNFQKYNNISGDIFEFGIFHGKSLALLDNFINDNENLIGVDFLTDKNELDNLGLKNFKYIKDYNFNLINNEYFTSEYRKCRFIHIDSGHSAQEVFNNLEYAHNLCMTNGIVCIDDLFTYKHPQVTEAIFHYLFLYPHRFKIVICAFDKCILVRPDFFTKLYTYATSDLCNDINNLGIKCALCKSSSLGDSTIISFLRNKQGSYGDLYEHKIDKIIEEHESHDL